MGKDKKKNKKDAQLVLRLDKDLRNRFMEACQELDSIWSEADANVDYAQWGFASADELVNWRLYSHLSGGLMTELAIPHVWRDGPRRKHDWHSGWVPEAVELLTSSPVAL